MGGAVRDLFIFMGVVVLIFIIWVATGGPGQADRGGTHGLRGTISAPTPPDTDKQFEELRAGGIASPYRGLVSFSGGAPDNDIAPDEYVRIRASGRLDAPVNITGWRIESLITSSYGTIPGATALPRAGVVNGEPPLLLPAGHTAIINSGRSPLGMSFRDNKCVAYLDPRDHFSPKLNRQCPDPIDEFDEFSGISPTNTRNDDYDECRDFVRRHINRCEITNEELDERDDDIPELPLADACIAFIERDLTYQGCVQNHQSDRDFYDDEWRVFLGSHVELWREENEVLRLLDQSGRVVDVWQY